MHQPRGGSPRGPPRPAGKPPGRTRPSLLTIAANTPSAAYSFPMTASAWGQWAIWASASVAALAGLVFLYFGLFHDRSRGRRRCPKCWYDLSGTRESQTCPECGFTAKSERALHRTRRRWRLAFLGFILLVVAGGIARYNRIEVQSVKPVWWLSIEMYWDGDWGELARKELIERGRDGRLSIGQQRRLADRVLAVQADPDAQWHTPPGRIWNPDSEWGTLFEEAWQRGALTDEQIKQYVWTAFDSSLSFQYRPIVRPGALIPVHLNTAWPRFSFYPRLGGDHLDWIFDIQSIDGAELARTSMPRIYLLGSSRFKGGGEHLRLTGLETPGSYEITVTLDMAVVRRPAQKPSWPSQSDFDDAMYRRQYTQTFTVEVLPPDVPSVALIPDPGLKDVIRNALQVNLELYKAIRPGTIQIGSIPIDISFDVFACADGREEYLGSVHGHSSPPPAADGAANDARSD